MRAWFLKPRLILVVCLLGGAGLAAAWWWFDPTLDAPAALRSADARIAARDLDAAGRLIDRVLRRYPRHVAALVGRGRVSAAQQNWADALRFFGRVPDGSPLAAAARYYEGVVYLETNRARPAEQALRRSMQLDPGGLGALEELASLYAAQLRNEPLREVLLDIRALRPWSLDELIWFVTGGLTWRPPAQRAFQMQAYAAADPEDLASARALAQVELSLEHADEAEQALREVLARAATDARGHALLAEVMFLRSDLPEAAAALRFTPSETPMPLWLARGQYAALTQDWAAAVEFLSEAARLDPNSIPANYRLGRALEGAGQSEAAAPYLERARLLDRLQQRSFRALGIDSTQAAELNAELLDIGDTLAELERWPDAAFTFERVAQQDASSDVAAAKYEEARRHAEEWARAGGTPDSTPPPYRSVAPPGGTPAARTADSHPSISFRDRHHEVGLDFQYFNGETGLKYLIESMGGGVAAIDFDGDGWPDLFFPQGCHIPVDPQDRTATNRLFRNRFGGAFEDVTEHTGLDEPGYGLGCAAGDYDNDGFPDLVVSRYGSTVLYRNCGDGTFRNVTAEAGLDGEYMSSSVALADLDRDGNLDLYIVNYLESLRVCRGKDGRPVTCHPRVIPAAQDVCYQSQGNGRFLDVTESSGLRAPDGKGLGIVVADLDDDGWPDIYVANDTTPNFLFHNETRGGALRFRDTGLASGTALSGDGQSQAGMGIACADFDGNGHLDLYVTNYLREYNTLYLNLGKLLFRDATRAAGLVEPTLPVLGFGTQAIDADLDGRPDLFVANGHVEDVRAQGDPWTMPPQFFYNLGAARFVDVSLECGPYFGGKYLGRGVARLDWDRDGRPDLVVVHQDWPAALLHNETLAGRKVVLDLVGVASNRDAVGARIVVRAGARTQVVEICGGDGYLATNERRQIIGIGAADRIDELAVRWPSGWTDHWTDLAAEQRVVCIEGHPPRMESITP